VELGIKLRTGEMATFQAREIQDPDDLTYSASFFAQYLTGNLLGLLAVGFVLCQCWIYLLVHVQDQLLFRRVIALGLVLLCCHGAFTMADTIYTFGFGFGNYKRGYVLGVALTGVSSHSEQKRILDTVLLYAPFSCRITPC